MGKEILVKTKQQIDKLEEKVVVREPPETSEVEIQIDTSDEANITFSPKSDVRPPKKEDQDFLMMNKHGIPVGKTIEVKMSDDLEESSDTVFGQGTAPNPEDETYLSLLKKSTKARVKVKVNEEDDEDDKEEIEVRISSDSGKQMDPNLNPSYVSGPKPK